MTRNQQYAVAAILFEIAFGVAIVLEGVYLSNILG